MSKLSSVVDTNVFKKTVNDPLVTKVNAIDSNKLIRKTDCNTKIKELEYKYITTPEFNKFSGEMIDGKLKQAKLKIKFITKTSFEKFMIK